MIDLSLLNPEPWIATGAVAFLEKFLGGIKEPRILEFGSGCSTLFFAEFTSNLISVEHSPKWHDLMQQALRQRNLKVDLRLISHNYYEVCQKFSPNYFDLIIIDGKYRMACLQAARSIVRPGGVIMLDDSNMREKYEVANEIMFDWQRFMTSEMKGNPLNPHETLELSETTWWIKST